jgi:hypothetical protein
LDLILVVDWYEVSKEYPISVPATNGKKKNIAWGPLWFVQKVIPIQHWSILGRSNQTSTRLYHIQFKFKVKNMSFMTGFIPIGITSGYPLVASTN